MLHFKTVDDDETTRASLPQGVEVISNTLEVLLENIYGGYEAYFVARYQGKIYKAERYESAVFGPNGIGHDLWLSPATSEAEARAWLKEKSNV